MKNSFKTRTELSCSGKSYTIFDISKIGPVGWVENNRQEKADIRVVGDDIMAAILSIIVVIFLLSVNLYVMQ